MIAQLRTYTIQPGEMNAWLSLFDEHIRPLHARLGIPILSTWVDEAQHAFVWLRSFDIMEDIERLEAAYFASPERQTLGDRPQQLIEKMVVRVLTPHPS